MHQADENFHESVHKLHFIKQKIVCLIIGNSTADHLQEFFWLTQFLYFHIVKREIYDVAIIHAIVFKPLPEYVPEQH